MERKTQGLKKHGIKTKITPSYDCYKMLARGERLWNIKKERREKVEAKISTHKKTSNIS